MTELWCLVETWQISLIHAITWNPPMTNRDFIDPNWGPPHLFLWLLEGIILFGLYFVCLRYFTHCKMVMDIFWHQWFMLSSFQVMAWCMSGTRARSWTNIKLLSVTLALNVIGRHIQIQISGVLKKIHLKILSIKYQPSCLCLISRLSVLISRLCGSCNLKLKISKNLKLLSSAF